MPIPIVNDSDFVEVNDSDFTGVKLELEVELEPMSL
eukprot:CAMPEP_0184665794 /NCGR_PEP_ID=MMETSP0308-20130426/58638_1 /TAXON_ID=38269 /ORGANISM="Gloeochaete witrockiana, Strain SAG 46.84" /LENGTH=35 /DNA_ID= /DNA_START= /DNA_END= /DNA_ORIENTATION=